MNKRWVIGLSLVLLASQGSSATAGVPSVVASADSEGTNQITAFGSEEDDLVADSMASAAAPATDMPLWRTNPAQAYPTATTRLVGDVTGDGRDDVVGFEVGIFVIPGGDAAPGPMVTYDPGLWVEDGVIGDINGDGIADVIAKQPTALQIYPGGISGGLGSRVTYSVGTVTAVDVLDANGDGRDDIAYLTPSGLSFLVQTPSGTLDAVDYPQAPDPGGHEDFTTGDFDGDGRVDFITWPGVLSFDPVGGPRIYLQTAPEVWVEAGAIAMEDSDHRVWTVGAFDLDGDGATEIVVSVMVMGAPDRYARLYWQEPGHLNTTDSTVAACREPHLAFSDADRNGLTDMACRGDAGIVLYRQIAERVFEQNFYLHLDGKSSSPLIGDFFGDSNPDLATTYIDGSFSARLYAGVSPGALGADLAVIRGAMETVDGLLDDICVEAISAHTGAILAETVSTAGGYRLDVPEGIYVLRMRDCRPHPRSPAGMSFLAHIWGGSSPVLVVATSESDRNVDLYTELQDDMTGTIVDDVSGEPLGGIRIWEGIKDWRISGHYWIANSTETDTSGSFTRYGSYRQIEVFVDDPLEVYP